MTTPSNIKLEIQVNAGSPIQGPQTVAFADALTLSIDDSAGVTDYLYEITQYPDGFALPSGWTLNASTGAYYSTAASPSVVNMPASPLWGKWFFRLIVNDAIRSGESAPDLIDEQSAVQIVSPVNSLKDIGALEIQQFDPTGLPRKGWVKDLQANLRLIETAIGAGALTIGAASANLLDITAGELTAKHLAINTTTNSMYHGVGAGNGDPAGASRNVGVGSGALTALTTGDDNVVVGYNAAVALTSGSKCVAIGASSMSTAATRDFCVAIGWDSMQGAVDEIASCIYIGASAGGTSGGGEQNVVIGTFAASVLQGIGNVVVGDSAMNAATTPASNNTVVGKHAGQSVTTGGTNLLLGASTDVPVGTVSNYMNIGDVIHGWNDAGSKRVSIGGAEPATSTFGDASLRLAHTDAALMLNVCANDAAVTTPENGMLMYSTATNTIRAYQNGAWSGFGGVADLQGAYTGGGTTDIEVATVIANPYQIRAADDTADVLLSFSRDGGAFETTIKSPDELDAASAADAASMNVAGGTGGGATGAGNKGGGGGDVEISMGPPGSNVSGAGGDSGSYIVDMPGGGNANGTNLAGGSAGLVDRTGGPGGAGNGSGASQNGTAFLDTMGRGGDASGTGVPGIGGSWAVVGARGGNSGDSSNPGGLGSPISTTGGVGGLGSGGSVSGQGGNNTVTAGAGGAAYTLGNAGAGGIAGVVAGAGGASGFASRIAQIGGTALVAGGAGGAGTIAGIVGADGGTTSVIGGKGGSSTTVAGGDGGNLLLNGGDIGAGSGGERRGEVRVQGTTRFLMDVTGDATTDGNIEMDTNTFGALILPRLTTTERLALTGVDGMICYDTVVDAAYLYANSAWEKITSL